jgi:predicted metal-dependent hydrolase
MTSNLERKLSNIPTFFPVRRLRVDFDGPFERYWYQQRTFETHWFNALSLGLPQAERYAIECIKQGLPMIDDAALVAGAKGFIGQEATHSFVHNKCNAALNAQGFSFGLAAYTRWRLSKAHWLSTRTGLAITASWEHFTAMITSHMLGNNPTLEGCAEPVRSLWLWHSAEELEHKTLAYDMYHATGGGYLRRVAWYLYGSGLFVSDFTAQTLYNMYRDKCLFSPRVWGEGLRYFFGRGGLFWFGLPRWLDYLRPGFSPGEEDHTPLVQQALAELDGRYGIVGASEPN